MFPPPVAAAIRTLHALLWAALASDRHYHTTITETRRHIALSFVITCRQINGINTKSLNISAAVDCNMPIGFEGQSVKGQCHVRPRKPQTQKWKSKNDENSRRFWDYKVERSNCCQMKQQLASVSQPKTCPITCTVRQIWRDNWKKPKQLLSCWPTRRFTPAVVVLQQHAHVTRVHWVQPSLSNGIKYHVTFNMSTFDSNTDDLSRDLRSIEFHAIKCTFIDFSPSTPSAHAATSCDLSLYL